MKYIVTAMLIIVAIIHLLPSVGVFGNEHLARLYGIDTTESNLSILMRHRAVLFGAIGLFMLVAAFRLELQATAFILGFISVISFLWLARSIGGYNMQVSRVFAADVVALC